MNTFRSLALTALLLTGVAVAPAAAVPLTVNQELTFTQVRGFGTYTDGTLTAAGWSLNPFPFTQASQIASIRFWFDSTDEDYVDGTGPTGGSTFVEISVLDDVPQKIGVASVNHVGPLVTLGSAQDPLFSTVRSLLVDGLMTVRLGAYESFPGFTRAMTLGGLSTLRVEVTGDVPATPSSVPEPGTLLTLGVGLVTLARRLSKKTPA